MLDDLLMYDTENEALYQDTNNSKEDNEAKQHLHGQHCTGVMSCLHYTERSINRLLDICVTCRTETRKLFDPIQFQ